jgi:hypothetical protein
MKNECSVVRDILPLFLEDMVSEGTSEFVREHLKHCSECAAEFEAMKAETKAEKLGGEMQNDLDAEASKSMKAIRTKFRKKVYRAAAAIAAIFIAICVLLHFFPIYRIVNIGIDYYSGDQIAKALYIGSTADRSEAQAVLRLADKAFSDTQHTETENKAEYGLLARYATNTESYEDAAFNVHSLELWSAHLGENEGWLWVYYTSKTFDHDGNTIRGSSRVPALWKVEKSESGEWIVVQIREHA